MDKASEAAQDRVVTEISHWLKTKMEQSGVTQVEAAERLGMKQSYVSRLLSGHNFTLKTLMRFTRVRIKENRLVFFWKGAGRVRPSGAGKK